MNALAPQTGLLPGFTDPVADSQKMFRAVLEAMSRPGTIVTAPVLPVAPQPVNPVAAALVLALADYETPLWLDPAARQPGLVEYVRFHCGCPLVEAPAQAAFALVTDAKSMPPLSAFHLGSDEYPDRSTTVIVQVPHLDGGESWRLKGPGIRDQAILAAGQLPSAFKAWVQDNHALFPRGVDLLFAAPGQLAALPRSTLLEG
ncbi:putative PhnH protein, phosphonate metabolism [Magnetospirillum gryphiswaldense MSR-1 v2]|uniref:PhnH protein, phosphonate metabolism n=1 Tax=Magnetospirillum gryphiswaldense (strain DSM 6361 / JCM 21280 / NBRC 15271 / MSR-1) TaxID=431944 RepID=V6EVM4_MAGGM|nr:phosphonate C-P lyase system protein PhnH [Magnetospirillum gryphiswaldense]CDK97290.1 putative PhnH protein, phosphonate metabolism [Magnetospirillum gryphiswaldense MSR-1 v2]